MRNHIKHKCRSNTRPRQISLAGMIAAYAEAKEEANNLWDRVAHIEEFVYAQGAEPVRVQYSHRQRGFIDDETGEYAKEPLYAYSEEEIAEICARDLELMLSMRGKGDATGRQLVREASEKRKDRLTAQFRELAWKMDKWERECGLTDAEWAASNASDRRSDIGETISYRMPTSLQEAALLAHWVMGASLNDDCDLLYSVLANIARAGGLAAGPPDMRMAQ